MRTLLLLRGIPGSGKSTWVRENHLEPYTLSADAYRLRVSAPVLGEDGRLQINQHTNSRIWDMLFADLEVRMKRGDFTIIDATHCMPRANSQYKKIADTYKYTVYCLDFRVPLDVALERNRNRDEYKQVPDKAIRKMHDVFTSPGFVTPSFITPITDFSAIDNYFTDDLDGKYDRVKVIGDVHGCYTVLKESIGGADDGGEPCGDPRTKYVFSGDMLERGLENREVMDFILEAVKKPNVVFVTGNHDEYVMNWCDDSWEVKKNGEKDIPGDFAKMIGSVTAGMDGRQQEAFRARVSAAFRRFRQCYAFTFGGRKYLVTHAGLSAVPRLTLIPTVQMIRGVGVYETDIDGAYKRSYEQGRCQGFIQVHGHRLSRLLDPQTYDGNEYSIDLEGRVEQGGMLKVLRLDKDGATVEHHPNTVYDPHAGESIGLTPDIVVDHIVTANPTTNQIIDDRSTSVKDLGNHNLISINFTARAFHKKRWNANTIKARGLFVDKTTGDIRLRSYNKFFNMGEMPFTQESYLRAHLQYPLNVYRKQNGFLGIMSVVDGDVILASKSTNNGPFASKFAEIFATLDPAERDALTKAAVDNHCSFTFEVCHVTDRHIIDFDTNHLWLLDAIPNSYTFHGADIDEEFSDRVKAQIPVVSGVMKKKVLLLTAATLDEVLDFEKAHATDRTIEGVVCQDRSGFMFKIKFPYYRTVKGLRAALQSAQRTYDAATKTVDTSKLRDPLAERFVAWFAARPYDEWKDIHIIDAVKLYEAANGPIM